MRNMKFELFFILVISIIYSLSTYGDVDKNKCPILNERVEVFCAKNEQKKCFEYAFCFQEKNPDRIEVLKVFRELCEIHKNNDACFMSAFNEIKSDKDSAIKKIKSLCENNHVMACKNILKHNSNVLSDEEIKNFHQKLKNHGIDSYHEIGSFEYLKKKKGLGLENLKISCDSGNLLSCSLVTQIYVKTEKDDTKLILHLDKVCKMSKGPSCSKLGHIYLKKNNLKEAMRFFLVSCDSKNVYGCPGKAIIEKREGKWKSALRSLEMSCNPSSPKMCKIYNDFKKMYAKKCNESNLDIVCQR